MGYSALCPEIDSESPGNLIKEARANLCEGLTLFFETASPEEIRHRVHLEVYVTLAEIAVGTLRVRFGEPAAEFRLDRPR